MNGEEGLPDNFDLVVIGTGVTESIVSAAASRNGHTVLHIDPREYYGGAWATLNFDSWITGEFMQTPNSVHSSKDLSEVKLKWTDTLRNFDQVWYSEDENVKEDFKKNARRFNIDVFPKVILAREEIIELLIKSNVSRYLEFLRVGKLLTSLPSPCDALIESIPLSRSDIFTSKSVSLVEKRSLVKFIEAILKPIEDEEGSSSDVQPVVGTAAKIEPELHADTKTFEELAACCKISSKVKHLIKAAVQTLEDGFSMDSDNGGEVFNQMFVTRCKKFLQSIGRYGNQTPYLWTLYGISEICQAFCRLSAVYGGLFILKRYVSGIEEAEDGVNIVSEQDKFKAKQLVVGPEMEYVKHPDFERTRKVSKTVGRGVLVTTGGTLKVEDKPSSKGDDGIYLYKIGELEVIEMNHLSHAVPKDYRLLQISFPIRERVADSGTPDVVGPRQRIESALSPFVTFESPILESTEMMESMHVQDESNKAEDANDPTSSQNANKSSKDISSGDKKPRVIYGSYFLIDFFEEDDELYRIKKGLEDPSNNMVGKILGCATGSTEITSHVDKAKEIFERIFPNEEFLPKAPDVSGDMEENGFAEPEIDTIPPNEAPVEVNEDIPVQEPADNENIPHPDDPDNQNDQERLEGR